MLKKFIILISVGFLCLFGCSKKNATDNNTEYMVYSSSNKESSFRRITENKIIDEETVEKMKLVEDTQLYPTYLFLSFYDVKNNVMPIRWNMSINDEKYKDSETVKQMESYEVLNYLCMVPYVDQEIMNQNITNKYIQSTNETYIQGYLSSSLLRLFELDDLDNEYSDHILLTLPTIVPIAMNENGGYKVKEVELVIEILGFINTYDDANNYIYLTYNSMNKVINEHKEGALIPYNYLLVSSTSNLNKFKRISKDLIIQNRISTEKIRDTISGSGTRKKGYIN